jgi:hypothetical protein
VSVSVLFKSRGVTGSVSVLANSVFYLPDKLLVRRQHVSDVSRTQVALLQPCTVSVAQDAVLKICFTETLKPKIRLCRKKKHRRQIQKILVILWASRKNKILLHILFSKLTAYID